MTSLMRNLILFLTATAFTAHAHDAHGRSTAPPEARRLNSPIASSAQNAAAGE